MIEKEVAMEVCDEDEHLDDESCFNAAEATENYGIAGSRVECDTSKVTRVRFGHLYDPDVDILVKQVLNEIEFVNKLSEAQEIFLHTIGSKKDLFALLNTGADKTEATGLAALLLRKVFKEPLGIIVVFVPLSGIMDELVANEKIVTAAVSMSGEMFGKEASGRVVVTESKVASIIIQVSQVKADDVEDLTRQTEMTATDDEERQFESKTTEKKMIPERTEPIYNFFQLSPSFPLTLLPPSV